MKSNFDYLKNNPEFREFAHVCVEAERSYSPTTATTTAIAVRRALEVTVKWGAKFQGNLIDNCQFILIWGTFVR